VVVVVVRRDDRLHAPPVRGQVVDEREQLAAVGRVVGGGVDDQEALAPHQIGVRVRRRRQRGRLAGERDHVGAEADAHGAVGERLVREALERRERGARALRGEDLEQQQHGRRQVQLARFEAGHPLPRGEPLAGLQLALGEDRRLLARRQHAEEELVTEATRRERRRGLDAQRHQPLAVEHRVELREHRGERDLAVEQLAPRGGERGGVERAREAARQQHAGLLEQLARGGAVALVRGRGVGREHLEVAIGRVDAPAREHVGGGKRPLPRVAQHEGRVAAVPVADEDRGGRVDHRSQPTDGRGSACSGISSARRMAGICARVNS
jgi:hypothetical protein